MPHELIDTRGNELLVNSDGSINVKGSGSLTDSTASPSTAFIAGALNELWNETTWDRQRGNTTGSLVSAASLTTTQTTPDQTNYNARGVVVSLDWLSGTGSVTLSIQAKAANTGKYVTLLAGVAASFVATNTYTVYPGAPVTANVSANAPLPRGWRVVVTANNANPASYNVGYDLIL